MYTVKTDSFLTATTQDVPDLPASARESAPQSSQVMTVKELIVELQVLESKVAKMNNAHNQRDNQHRGKGSTVGANTSPSRTAKEEPNTKSSFQLSSTDTDDERPVDSFVDPDTADEALRFYAELVGEAIVERPDDIAKYILKSPSEVARSQPENQGTKTGRPRAYTRAPRPAWMLQTDGEQVATEAPKCDNDSAVGPAESDVYNSDPDPFACALYTPAQLSLFGGFLHSPFAPSAFPPEDPRGISPFDTQPDPDDCPCERCLAFEVAVNKDPKELSPLLGWVQIIYSRAGKRSVYEDED